MARPIVIVTGATGGVGFSICQRLLFQLCHAEPTDALPQAFAVNGDASKMQSYDGLTLILACRSVERAEAARTRLLGLLNSYIDELQKKPGYDGHACSFRENLIVDILFLDLAMIDTIFIFANEIAKKYPYISHLILNAGVASFNAIDWIGTIKQILVEPVNGVTAPRYYDQHCGEVSIDGLGQSNLFCHYVLYRSIQHLLASCSSCLGSRVVWSSSIEASPDFFDSEDWQNHKSKHFFKSMTYQIDLISTRLDQLALQQPASQRIRHFVTHPGVCSTNVPDALIGFLFNFCKVLVFYLVRFLGSSNHTIDPFKAAIAAVHISLAPLAFVTLFDKTDGTTPRPAKFGAETDRWGRERVGVMDVEKWTEYQMESDVLLNNFDALYQSLTNAEVPLKFATVPGHRKKVQLGAQLKEVVWGEWRTQASHKFKGPFKIKPDDFMAISCSRAVDLLDFCIRPFKNSATSVSLSAPSQAAEAIPDPQKLKAIRRDPEWIEELISVTRRRLGDRPLKDDTSEHARMALWMPVYRAAYLMSSDPEEGYNESIENNRTKQQIELADCFLRCVLNKDEDIVSVKLQKPIPVSGAKSQVKPDATMIDQYGKTLAWYEDKTILVQFHHAQWLEDTTTKGYSNRWPGAIRGIYKQAYALTQSMEGPACKIVRMGNDGLYRWAYAVEGSLVVSGWRSINKAKAEKILQQVFPETQFQVTQGYPVLENVAIYDLTTRGGLEEWIADRKSRWDKLNVIQEQTTTILNMMVDFRNDAWTTLCNIFRGEMQRTLIVGKVPLTGLLSSYNGALDKDFTFFKTPMWKSPLKEAFVWSNGKWVVKVSTAHEKYVLESLVGVPGVQQLGGSFKVTIGKHKGSLLLFTRYIGEPVDNIISDRHVRESVRDALCAVHEKGWHHHDIHPGNVLQDNKNRIHLIDFGLAVRAKDCSNLQSCPDNDYLFEEDEETLVGKLKAREELETESEVEESEKLRTENSDGHA